MKLLYTLSFLLTLSAHADSAKRDVYLEQERIINEILDTHLPEPMKPKEEWDTAQNYLGKTSKGKSCVINRSRGVSIVEMDGISDVQKNYGDISFRWEADELDSNILGAPLRPEFKATDSTLEASARVPRGFGSIFNFGLKLKFDDYKISVSVRNHASMFGKFYECIFIK